MNPVLPDTHTLIFSSPPPQTWIVVDGLLDSVVVASILQALQAPLGYA